MNVVPDLKRDIWYFGSIVPTPQLSGIQTQDNLTPVQRKILDSILEEKFKLMGKSLGYTTLTEHEIITDAHSIKQRYYPVSPFKQRIIDEELKNIIEPSKSAWSSPILLISKRDGGYHFCVDYHALNAVTKKDAYPLPYISAILDRLRDAKYLSSMDIKSAYWQVPVKKSCRELAAFTVPGGRDLFHFKRMPFGLSNAPAAWQRLIDTVLGPKLEPHVLVYLDDIISHDFDAHIKVLSEVFDRLFGVPSSVIVDNGVQFRSSEFRKLMVTYNVQICYTANYHPQANPTERFNRVLKTMLSSFVEDNHRKLDIFLPKIACAICSAKHEVIGNKPYFINF